MLYEIILVIYSVIAISLIVLIMLQKGKGISMGGAFSSGASGTLFGSIGSGNFITHMTAILATFFFIVSLLLCNFSAQHSQKDTRWNHLNALHQLEKIPDDDTSMTLDTDIPQ